jgi:hypothetical protein
MHLDQGNSRIVIGGRLLPGLVRDQTGLKLRHFLDTAPHRQSCPTKETATVPQTLRAGATTAQGQCRAPTFFQLVASASLQRQVLANTVMVMAMHRPRCNRALGLSIVTIAGTRRHLFVTLCYGNVETEWQIVSSGE